MIEVKGAYATAKVFTDRVDAQSLAQVQTLCDQPFVAGSQIRLMPDVHAGAGRLMSRAEAKRVFSVEAFRQSMAGIYTTTADQSTLDECPMAYKPIEAILDNIAPTADVVARIRPLYNYKAAGD